MSNINIWKLINRQLYTVTRKKTDIVGLWKDNNGKIYRDNIIIKEYISYVKFQRAIGKLFSLGEKAVFYIVNGIAAIEYAPGAAPGPREESKIEYLVNCIRYNEKNLKASYIKTLLKNHAGITIFRNKGCYTIEIWK